MLEGKKVAFIGAGSMAESIFAGLISEQLLDAENIIVTNKSNHEKLQRLHSQYGVSITTSHKEAMEKAEVIVLAMKPKHIEESAHTLKEHLHDQHLLISVLAGVSTSYMEQLFGGNPAIIRTMPNTSAKVGASATVICAGQYATEDHIQMARALFSAVGAVSILHESEIDRITGISGSGPAYMYYFVEAMEEAAAEAGLPEEESKELIIQTLAGAAKRLRSSEKTPKELYQEVMSPNGTTEAAFRVLEENNVAAHFKDAMKASMKRAAELGSSPES
ncbi:pyrroline-5-carboxylate reductase [Alteribacillus iranensis]|uniref:Pyrroline-5-carboxylate reductase n=1 Tax=Alteribacillus iranensis TaxID=930128 RepID=A0A1I2ADW3_9BACI|nr:pyrroline-5-carboxylate reductase [Alteribacillus iranensis]SFE41738.1 pyrroline-5-carboxylate reductase [Alteribacillus iranensis]